MRIAAATLRTAAADAVANRSSFWFQVWLMIANDVTWIVFWALFFHGVGTIHGWDVNDVLVLFSILLTTAGASIGLFSNCRRIGHFAADGALDEALALPVSPLSHLLTRRIDPSNLGDLLFGPVLFLLVGHPTPERTALFLLGSVCGTIVLVSFLVICGSLTLFVGGRGEQADLGFNAILIFASYPLDLFGGATKVLLYTAVPAAFVTGIPARLVRSFNPEWALAMILVTAAVAALAAGVFALGLRRYSSGSLWTTTR
jgi:ABC-2 type transport system permease protein